MKYSLDFDKSLHETIKPFSALKKLLNILSDERKPLAIALIIMIVHSVFVLSVPFIIGYTIDAFVQTGDYSGLLRFAAILVFIFIITLNTSYWQTKVMGSVAQRVLFKLRNNIFSKLQELPVAFFHENKAGDLISRINNDTDKLSQFFSQSLLQFISSLFIMTGAGIFLVSLNPYLGTAALIPAVLLLLFSRIVTPWVKRLNRDALATTGNLSAEIQESLANFKVVVAFNRRDYFRDRFNDANLVNYTSSLKAGIANSIFIPVYTFFSNMGQLIVLTFGIVLILKGKFTIGILISFLSYIQNFYNPLRQLAAIWSGFQVALAGWDRISQILNMVSDITAIETHQATGESAYLSFRNVSFSYPSGKEVLHQTNFELEKGKTYAFVGPTGGGKTTTASLISRLYDPTKGVVLFNGKDLRTYSAQDRAAKIGFILQDPLLFSGTIGDNILYGNQQLAGLARDEVVKKLNESGLEHLMERFDGGLDMQVTNNGNNLSLGQKQLIAFFRAILRNPELIILDEATANIDTLTEQQLEIILKKLDASTTRIVIAHRLNTIENADEIYFINGTSIVRAGSMKNALHLLMEGKRDS
jgi:ATP-binding cassette subfamily B protein